MVVGGRAEGGIRKDKEKGKEGGTGSEGLRNTKVKQLYKTARRG